MTEEEIIRKIESENITLASLNRRFAAYLIDEVIIVSLILFYFFDVAVAAVTESYDKQQFVRDIAPYLILIKIAYQTLFVYMYGATLGKMVVKIRIICLIDVEKPNLAISFIRSSMRIVSESLYFAGFLWAFVGSKRQTWQDIAAKTLVINA